jgi:hypothetical protein
MVGYFGNPSGRGVVIDCLSSSNGRVYLGSSFASQRFEPSQGESEVPNWEFLFRCGPSKPLRFKLSYQKTSSQDSGKAPMIGLCSAIDQQFTVPTGQIVAAADRNNRGSPWERRLFAVGSDWRG